MDTLIKLNSSRVGRDKIFRTLQYGLRAINSRPYLATNESRDLEKTLASFRKLLRLGTFIDVLQSARQSIHFEDFFTRCRKFQIHFITFAIKNSFLTTFWDAF